MPDDLVGDKGMAECDTVVCVCQGDGETGSSLAVHTGGNNEALLVEVLQCVSSSVPPTGEWQSVKGVSLTGH